MASRRAALPRALDRDKGEVAPGCSERWEPTQGEAACRRAEPPRLGVLRQVGSPRSSQVGPEE